MFSLMYAVIGLGFLVPRQLPAQSHDKEWMKKELIRLVDFYDGVPQEELRKLDKQGDMFQAALEIFRDEEATGYPNGLRAVVMMGVMKLEDKERARSVFLPYLGTWDSGCRNFRWCEAVDFVLQTQDPEGERWIKAFLEAPAETCDDMHVKGSLIETIGIWGRPHWIDRLRGLSLTPVEVTELSLDIAGCIEKLEGKGSLPSTSSPHPQAPAKQNVGQESAPQDQPAPADPVKDWRAGKGPFPFLKRYELTEEELICGLRELKSTRGKESAMALSYILEAIWSKAYRKAIPAMQRQFEEWTDAPGKLILASRLLDFGDYRGVDYAVDLFKKASDSDLRGKALRWVLHKVLPIDQLEAFQGAEKDALLKLKLEGLVKDRRGAEAYFRRERGHDIREEPADALEKLIHEMDNIQGLVSAELFRRHTKGK